MDNKDQQPPVDNDGESHDASTSREVSHDGSLLSDSVYNTSNTSNDDTVLYFNAAAESGAECSRSSRASGSASGSGSDCGSSSGSGSGKGSGSGSVSGDGGDDGDSDGDSDGSVGSADDDDDQSWTCSTGAAPDDGDLETETGSFRELRTRRVFNRKSQETHQREQDPQHHQSPGTPEGGQSLDNAGPPIMSSTPNQPPQLSTETGQSRYYPPPPYFLHGSPHSMDGYSVLGDAVGKFAYLLNRMTAPGGSVNLEGGAPLDAGSIQSNQPFGSQSQQKGEGLGKQPAYGYFPTKLQPKQPYVQLKQLTPDEVEEHTGMTPRKVTPGLEDIINPEGVHTGQQAYMNKIVPPREYQVYMAGQGDEANSGKKNIKIPLYEPKMNPIEWWSTYLSYCKIHKYADRDRIEYFKFHLGSEAMKWYYRLGIGSADTIDKLKEAFFKQYSVQGPNIYTYKRDLYEMRQGRDTCSMFAEKVIDACRHLFKLEEGDKISDQQFDDVKAIVMGGANARARDHLVNTNPKDITSLMEAATTATFLEKQDRGNTENSVAAIRSEIATLIAPIKDDIKALRTQSNDDQIIHQVEQSPKKCGPKTTMSDLICSLNNFTKSHTTGVVKPPESRCFFCGEAGHYMRDCPHSPNNDLGRPGPSPPAIQSSAPANRNQTYQPRYPRNQYNGYQKAEPGRLQVCQICNKSGHTALNCWELEKAGSRNGPGNVSNQKNYIVPDGPRQNNQNNQKVQNQRKKVFVARNGQ